MISFAERLYRRLNEAQFNEFWDNYDEVRFGAQTPLSKTDWIKWQVRRASRRIGFYRLSWMLRPNSTALHQWMNLVPELEWLSQRLSDDESRELLVDLVAYRIMGYKGVRLPLGNEAYRRRRKELESLADFRDTIDIGFMGWSLARYRLETFGISGNPYAIHDARTPAMMHFLRFLDAVRAKPRPWLQGTTWPQRFALQIS